MSNEEFENRDRQYPVDGITSGTRRGGRSAAALGSAPQGSPRVDFSVRSIFDARPLFSQEFLRGIYATPELINATNARFTASFKVPPGYVGILRSATISLAPIAGADIPQEPTTTGEFIRNGTPAASPEVGVGSAVFPAFGQFFLLNNQESYPTFTMGDENDTLGINLYLYDTADPTSYVVLVNFAGQFLKKTGTYYQYEIANKGA